MGSVAPKINAHDELTMVRSRLQQNVTLLCPAQSYPVPVFRQFKGNLSLKQYFLYNVLEPVDIAGPRLTSGDKTRIVDEMLNGSITLLCPKPISSTVPKVNSLAKFDVKTFAIRTTFALLCPAQGYPVPIFSTAPKVPPVSARPIHIGILTCVSLLCPAQAYPKPHFRPTVYFFMDFLSKHFSDVTEPTGAKAPTLPGDIQWSGIVRKKKPIGFKKPNFPDEVQTFAHQAPVTNTLALICQEPMGSKAPTFSSDSKGSIFVRSTKSSFALLCQAQAYPVPIIRNLPKFLGRLLE
uniref:Uncharacterized protein n=1 Tax=Glossina austeni TaxID=7395 RepID=A0A1A9V526_GLOAU